MNKWKKDSIIKDYTNGKKGANGNMCQAVDEMMEDARKEGEMSMRINSMIKKIKKGYSLERIAEELEEPEVTLQNLYHIILKYGPDYPNDQILKEALQQA